MVNRLNSGLRRRLLERRDAERQRGDGRGERPFDETVADHDQLRVALLGLPPRQRAAIVLRYFEDLREIEVAAVLGTSVGTVKAYVSRGLDRLRTVVDER
jgi:RNA polymerase sigma factor (sigma-70 family)